MLIAAANTLAAMVTDEDRKMGAGKSASVNDMATHTPPSLCDHCVVLIDSLGLYFFLVLPPFSNIRKISCKIAKACTVKAYDLGLATRLPRPINLFDDIRSNVFNPAYTRFL